MAGRQLEKGIYVADHKFVNPKYIFTSWLLVGVGHHATDEVWLSLVEGAHQVVQLALEVGGDCLAATLLLVTTIILIMIVLMIMATMQ